MKLAYRKRERTRSKNWDMPSWLWVNVWITWEPAKPHPLLIMPRETLIELNEWQSMTVARFVDEMEFRLELSEQWYHLESNMNCSSQTESCLGNLEKSNDAVIYILKYAQLQQIGARCQGKTCRISIIWVDPNLQTEVPCSQNGLPYTPSWRLK